jgi:uncharacterized membrane protein YoaK (UPF0700 family)
MMEVKYRFTLPEFGCPHHDLAISTIGFRSGNFIEPRVKKARSAAASTRMAPLQEESRFTFGVLLTAIAGWVDAIGFLSLGGFYVSFMSGNTTQLAIGMTRLDMDLVRVPAVLLGCFVLGAFGGTLVSTWAGRWSFPGLLVVEGLLLACAVLLSVAQGPIIGPTAPLAMAMGSQNAALRSESGDRIGGTFVTGTVFGLGAQLALWCAGRGGPRPALRHALGWIALAVGAAAGTWAFAAYGLFAIAFPAACLFALAGLAVLMDWRSRRNGR